MSTESKGIFSFFKGIVKPLSKEEDLDIAMEVQPLSASDTPEPPTASVIGEDVVRFATDTLSDLFEKAGFPSEIQARVGSQDRLILEIHNEQDLGRIIGKDGIHLEAWQTILRAILFQKYKRFIRVMVDAGDYRNRKFDGLRNLAMNAARKVMREKRDVALRPMSAVERRFVHLLFETHDRIQSTSVGEGGDRHVVLEYIHTDVRPA